MRRVFLLAALLSSESVAAPNRATSQPIVLNGNFSPTDAVADRDHEREAEARWFVVGADKDGMYMIDRSTLQRRGALRDGWAMAFKFANGGILMRAAIHRSWNCTDRTATTLTLQTYDANGTPDPMDTAPQRAEPIIPESIGEAAFDYVCDMPARGQVFPMAVSRDPVSAAEILAAYADDAEVTVLGLLLATLDPWKDEARLHDLLSLEKPNKRTKLAQLIWSGLR